MSLRIGVVMVLYAAAVAQRLPAQGGIRPSQHATVSQRVGYTDISIRTTGPSPGAAPCSAAW